MWRAGPEVLQALKEHFVRWLAPTFSALWNWGKKGEEVGGRNVIFDPEFIGSPKRYKELQREECDLAAFHAGI